MYLQVHALEVRIGDKITNLGESDFIVDQIERGLGELVPPDIRDQGGWVVLTGDSEDGHYQRHYGGKESYYAAPDELIDIERSAE